MHELVRAETGRISAVAKGKAPVLRSTSRQAKTGGHQ